MTFSSTFGAPSHDDADEARATEDSRRALTSETDNYYEYSNHKPRLILASRISRCKKKTWRANFKRKKPLKMRVRRGPTP